MIRARFWSTFSSFSDAELEAGIQELLRKEKDEDAQETTTTTTTKPLRFEDRVVLIVAKRDEADDEAADATEEEFKARPASFPLGVRVALEGHATLEDEVLSKTECDAILNDLDVDAPGGDCCSLTGNARFKLHLLYPKLDAAARHPKLLKAAAECLGTEDLLIWSSDLVAKPAHSKNHFTPHQDSAYAGLLPADAAVTAWLALTDASEAAGCLRFYPGSHLRGHLPHRRVARDALSDDDRNNMLAFAQTVPDSVLADLVVKKTDSDSVPLASSSSSSSSSVAASVVAAPLRAGECSWHAMRTVHWSPPNETDRRRVGFAIRYVRADIQRVKGDVARESATLASGRYDAARGCFDLEPRPTARCGTRERAAHADAMRREKANYFRLESTSSSSTAATTPASYA